MADSCAQYVSTDDLKAAKESILHIEHVATSKDANGNPALVVTDPIRGVGYTNATLDGLFSDIGFKPVNGSFEDGGTLVNRWDVLLYETNGGFYQWLETLPLTVPAGSSPFDSSGELITGWVDQTDLTLRTQLITENFGFLVQDSNIRTKRNDIGSIERSQKNKNSDVLNVKDFGAIGDGLDHPLSEKFSTLIVAQMVYPFVTALTQTQDYAGIQAAINAAKLLDAGVFIPSGKYVVNTGLLADYALSMYGEGSGGLRDIASSGHSPSPVRGSIIMSKVASGRTLSIVGTPGYSFGMTLRDFAIWGVEGQCDAGLYTHNIGWTGILSGINIQRFPNQAWEIGYIQDTYVNNCTFLYSGSRDKPAVHCPNLDSNYIYFNGCHFECSPYLIGFDDVWFVSFTQCHFEIARPINGSLDDRYVYQTAPIRLGATTRQVQFSNNTFIPTDVGFLASKLGVARDQVPYFITGNGNSISFNGDIFMAPEGSVNAAYLSGSGISVQGVKFIRMSPSKEFLHIGGGHVANCTFGIDAAEDTTKLYGVYVGAGSVIGNEFGFYGADSGGKRPEGGLLFGGATASGNSYPDDNRVFIFLDVTMKVDGYDGGDARFSTITASLDVDLTKVHPSTHYDINGNGVAITNIFGAPLGRDLVVRVSGGTSSGVKYVAGAVETQGATDWSPGASRTSQFKCIRGSAGKVMYQL